MLRVFRKRFKLIFVVMLFSLTLVNPYQMTTQAQVDDTVIISVFVRDDCGHCIDEEAFLAELEERRSDFEIKYYNLDEKVNQDLFTQVTEAHGLTKGTPVTMIGQHLIQGFDTSETTGVVFESIIDSSEKNLLFEDITDGGALVYDSIVGAVCDEFECVVEGSGSNISFLGMSIDIGEYSLVGLSAILGFVDGFNPCAMWVLVMFLIILSQLGSRKKMMQYAGIFILAEAIMYYLILNVWFTVWDFVSLDRIVTPLVGLLAFGSGVYFVYKFINFKSGCDVTNLEQKSKISSKVKKLAAKPLTIGVFIGILGLALSVNIFEFACSIGIPQTFTKVLELNQLNWLQTQWYMLTYIALYMIDDLIVFGLALWAFEKIGLTDKYSKWSTLVGGILMLALGVIMLLNPALLVF